MSLDLIIQVLVVIVICSSSSVSPVSAYCELSNNPLILASSHTQQNQILLEGWQQELSLEPAVVQRLTNLNPNTSPSFGNRETDDIPKESDLIRVNMTAKAVGLNGTTIVRTPPWINIEAVDYHSDGKLLNATIWLRIPLTDDVLNDENTRNLEYGMYIDSDASLETGSEGIDYQSEIQWKNESQTWMKTVSKLSPYGEQRVLQNVTIPSESYEPNGNGVYIALSTDLALLQHPERYKIIFYSGYENQDGVLTTDFTSWLDVPMPRVDLSTIPTGLTMIPGEEKTIEVKINASSGYELTTQLNLTSRSAGNDILAEFHSGNYQLEDLKIPTYGEITVPLKIKVAENATLGSHTVLLTSATHVEVESNESETIPKDARIAALKNFQPSEEQISSKTSLSVIVEQKPDQLVQVADMITRWSPGLTFISGILAGAGPWIYSKLSKWRKNHANHSYY